MNSNLQKLFGVNIIHGRYLCQEIINKHPEKLKQNKIKFSKDLAVITVLSENVKNSSTLRFINLHEDSCISYLTVPKYIFWISKVETLYYYIQKNYDTLPNYILYLDGLDTLVLKSIEHPSKYLDFYKCKVLFNVENQYAGTGYEPPTSQYLHEFYNQQYTSFIQKNNEKYGNDLPFGLNAGVFLGEKKFVLQMLEEALSFMKEDTQKGFPYGCTDDQYVFRYLHNIHYGNISADIFNIFSFWGAAMSLDDNKNNLKFKLGYNKRFLKDYLENR
jgi:hypothetical protein